MIEDEQLVKVGPWRGVNTVDREESLGDDELRELVNADLDRKGSPSTRAGRTRRIVASGDSLFSNGSLMLIREGGALVRLVPKSAATFEKVTLRNDLNSSLRLSYTDVFGTIYYSNGEQSGRILSDASLMPISVPVPDAPTLTAQSNGNLDAGDYQVCLTNVDATGEESGAKLAAKVTVSAQGSVLLSDIPQMTGASFVRVYMTAANGDDFFRHVEIPIGVTSYTIPTTIRGPRLETQFCEEMPHGQIVREYRGRLYVAQENVVWFSQPLRYGLCKRIHGYLPEFPERITVMQPVFDGLFIVSDKAYFIAGNDPHKAIQVMAHPHRAAEGSGTAVKPKMFGANEAPGMLAYWFSDNGPCIGHPGGRVDPVTENTVAHSSYGSGASLFREVNGIRSMVTALREKGSASSFGATDSLTFEVRRYTDVLPKVKNRTAAINITGSIEATRTIVP